MKVFKLVCIGLLFILPFSGMAQYDYEHYVPPFYCSAQVGKQELFLSTNSEKDLSVFIEDGQGNTVAGPFTINRNQSKTYVFKTPGGATYSSHNSSTYPDGCSYSYGIIGPKELNKPLDGQGLRIYSYDGPFFANIRHGFSNGGEYGALTHGGSLSAKGAYAKGKDFYSGHLYSHTINYSDPSYSGGYPIRSHFISVMAVEDGQTTVNFSGIKCKYITKYDGANVVLESIDPSDVITGTLSKGQSYVIGVNLHTSQFSGETAMVRNGMNGTHITSTQKIVVNCGSWTAGAKPSQDIGFDQIVPVDQVRDKYIVMKGEGKAEPDPTAYYAGQERTIVVATQANTEVWVNGNNKGTLANAGDFIILDDIVNPKALPTLYIDTKDKDVYVYQTMCGTNQDWTNIGLNFIPPLTGLGIKEVVIPQANYITTGAGGLINPTVTVLSQKNVDVQRNGTSLSNPQDVPGTTEWVYYKVPNISGDCRFTGSKAINVAWTASSNTLGAAGYYSGFTKAVSPIHPVLNIDKEISLVCESYDENISVALVEPFPDFYEWYVNDFTGDPIIENGPLVVPAPDVETIYYVLGYYRDPSLDLLFNGDFSDGFNGFDSDYDIVTSNLVDPGYFALASTPVAENPVLADFGAMDGGRMFLGYSDRQGEVVYQVNELPVEENFSYIFKLHGRLAKENSTYNQSLKVLINDETIIEDFKIDKSTDWQSVSALWKPGTARKATIKILNHNLDTQDAFFALDSISFVQAVQDTAKFIAKVVPNFSYGSDGDIVHFCKGVSNSLDVSNGDISWYDYSWSKGGVDLIDGTEFSGVKSHELVFVNPQESQEGKYICTIGFKPEYQDCGTSDATVDVTVNVLVDEAATVKIDADKTNFCSGATANLNALVTGDAGGVKWFVNGGTSPVSVENPYLFNYPTGTYTVRCEVENGCGVDFDEVVINVLSSPDLVSLTSNDNLCVGEDIIVTALATGDGTLVYTWGRDTEILAETGNILNYPASMLDREATFKVKVKSVYTIAGETVECINGSGKAVFDLNIIPLVEFDKLLADAVVCEGDNHSYSVTMKYPGDFYTYSWNKDGVDLLNNLSSFNLTDVKVSDDGSYRVDVTNQCNSGFSAADLIVTPEMKVNGFSLDKTGPFCSAANVTATFDVVSNGAVYIYQVIEPSGTVKTITNPYTFTVDASNQGAWEFLVSSSCDAPVSFKSSLNLLSDFGTLSVADVGTCVGENITFEAKISSIPVSSILTYVWTDNLGNPIGTNSDQLELLNVQDADFGNYSVLVTDQCGNTKTATADLTKEAVISPATGTSSVCVGDNYSTTISYLGSPTFEWRFGDKDSGLIVGTTETLSLTNVSLADAGVYFCNVTLSCGTAVIQRELKVNTHVSLVDSADKIINICEGEKPLLSLLTTEINGNPADYSIVWKDNTGTNIGTGTSIQLDAHNIAGSFLYTATVVGMCETPIKTYRVIVHAKPTLSAVDNSITECSGPISLDVLISGSDHNGIVWWKDGAVITDGNIEPTNFVLNPATSPSDDGDYIAKIETDYCGDAQVTINLDVRNTIVVTNQSPANTVVCENVATNLFVTAIGDDIRYNWYKTTDPATTLSDKSNLDLGKITLVKAGEYKCELSNDLNCGNQTLTFDVQVNKDAAVTNPLSVTMCETDADPVFTVTGTGEAPVTYQWYDKNNIAVAGATSNSLTVTSPVNGQSYYCVVSGSTCNTATSAKATLTIIKNVSVTDPSDLTISDGANANFSVVASGEPFYTYQWQENTGSGWNNLSNGGKYSGVNLPTLQITGADQATFNGNQYRCEVISSGAVCASSVISNPATLTVTEVTKIAVQPTNTTVCFNTNANISAEGTTAGLTYTWYYKKGAGAYETAYGKDGITISEVGQVSTLTILADDLDINNWKFKCVVSDGVSADQVSNEIVINVLEDIAVTTADATYNPCVGQAFSMAVTATGDAIKYKWYKVGAEATILSTSASYNMSTISLVKAGTYKCEVYNELACHDEVRSFVVNVKALPTVTNPTDVTMCANDADPTFTVMGTAEGIVNYEWYDKDDNLVVGATSNILTVTSPVNGQSYYAVVSGDYCSTAKSNSASLTVLSEVSTTNPVDITVADGGNASFKVTASGEPIYSYQWQEDSGSGFTDLSDGGEYSGTTSSQLKLTGVLMANGFDGNIYRCIVTSSSCSGVATSSGAVLTLNNIIKIKDQPVDQKLCETNTATFTVEGTGAVTSFIWKYDKGTGFVDADGQDNMTVVTGGGISTLTVPNSTIVMNSWTFKCVLSDGLTDDDTNVVQLEVYETINVTTAVTNNLSKCEGESLVLPVATSSGSNIQYKWYESTSPGVVLSTSSSYDLGNVSLANEKTYKCDVYNDLACGDATISYVIDIKEDATVTDPADKVMCASDANPVFSVTGTAEGTVNYEWFDKDGTSVGNTSSLTVTTPVDGQSYYCVVSGDACNTATSAVAILTVYEEVSIVDDPLNSTIPDGGNATFTVKATGEPDYIYQWQEDIGSGWSNLSNGGKYAGVTSATLIITGADQTNFNGNQYRCVVGNTKCSANATSNLATLTITSVVKISGQPQNMEACLGGAVDFEITGKTLGLNYDWEYSTDGTTFNTVTGVPELNVVTDVNGSKLRIASTTLAMNSWTFRCIVSDGVSADETSGVASLNVVEPVSFDAIDDQNLCFGIEKQISLSNLIGTEPITFSWLKDAAEISTTSNVSIGAGDNGNYKLTAGNGGVCPDKKDDFVVYHYDELTIAAWSNSSQVCIGNNEVLSVDVTAIDPAKTAVYKWYKDGAPIAISSTYTLVAADKTQSGQYKVEVLDGCSTKTVFGYVNVYEPILASNTWDAETTLCVGTELKLETKVTGDVTSYVWTKDGVGFSANSTYLKSNVNGSDAGTYVCTVSGNCGADIVYVIKVNVLAKPEITTGIDAIAAVCSGDPLELGPISVTGTYDNLIWTLNDNSTNSTAGTVLDLGTAELTEAGNYIVAVSNKCGSDFSLGNQVINPILALDPIAPQTTCAGNDVVFRAVATGASLNYQWLVDGVDQLVNSSELVIDAVDVITSDLNASETYNVECKITSTTGCGDDSQSTTLTVKPNTLLHTTLKNVPKYVGETYTMTVDVSGVDLVFEWTHELADGTKVPLTETGPSVTLTNITMADAGYYTCKIIGACGQRLASGKLTVKEPVTIVSGLNDLEEKCIGDPLSLSVSATGQIWSVKWFKNDVEIVGETSLNLYYSALGLADAAVYKCEIEGEGISVLTEKTTVRVYSQTALITPLEDRTFCEGITMDWNPDIDGTSSMTFEWTMNGAFVSDQKILHSDALALSDEGNYEIQVTSMCGDVSSSANLEVVQLPVYVASTAGTSICENEPLVEFTVEYTGEQLKYQWRKDGIDLPGKTSETLSLTNIQLSDAGDYNCRVYSTCGEEFSPVATLNVTAQLQVLSDQVDMEVCAGEDVSFTADAVGNNVNYQWKFDGVDIVDVPGAISGSNTSSLSIVSSQVSHSGYYTCILSDDCTDYRSTKPTELVVHALPNTAIYGRMVLCAKEDRVTYVLNQVGADVYSWNVNGGIFAGPEEGAKTRVTWEELSPGSLSVSIMDLATGCKSRVDSAVVLNSLPNVNLTNLGSKGVCENEFVLTGGFPEGGIYWVNGISQTEFNPSDRGAGTYAVHYSYTDGNGCSNVTPITNLTVDVLPVVDITDDITVGSCIPTPLSAKTDEDNIQWFRIQDNNRLLPDNLDNPNSMNPTFTPGKSQVLLAMVKDEHGCEGIDLLNLSVAPLPVVTTINDTTVSQCNQLVLQTDIVGDQDVISWTNPDHLDHADVRSPKIIDAPAGTHTYAINVTDLYGCDAAGEVTVTMVADPTLGEDKFGCEGDKYEIDITGMENPVWSDDDSSPARTIDKPGEYKLEVSNDYGCGDEQLFVINPKPNLGLKDTLIFEGQTVTFGPNLPSDYAPYFFEWQDGSIFQRFEVSETGTYKLKVEDNLGCVAIDSAYVEVKPVGIESSNAFLPLAGDGTNDRFYVGDNENMGGGTDDRLSIIKEYEMYVYDRWGEMLYKTNEQGYKGGWNGQYKGKICPAGAYVWVVFINGELTNKGTFMLIR